VTVQSLAHTRPTHGSGKNDSNMVKGRIYKIWSPGRPEVYVGSSTKTLAKVRARHQCFFRNWLHDKCGFFSSFYIFYQKIAGHPVHFETLYEGEFENVDALLKLEREYIEKLPTVNQNRPILYPEERRSGQHSWVPCPKCNKIVRKDKIKYHQLSHLCKPHRLALKAAEVSLGCPEDYMAPL
jgi:hypothetical protein